VFDVEHLQKKMHIKKGGIDMDMEIKICCCQGVEHYSGQCLRDRCPHYSEAECQVWARWPWTPTGFGNLHGEPSHKDFLTKVRENIRDFQKP